MTSDLTNRKTWIYLSPHFDDAALSCGGTIWEQAQAGARVKVWTVCGGDIPGGPLSPFAQSLHARWGSGREAVAQRRAEDRASCRAVTAGWRRFPVPDCIYRYAGADYFGKPHSSGKPAGQAMIEHLYASEQAIFGEIHPAEQALVEQLRERLAQALPGGAEVVCPLALGGHVDHRLVRAAAEGLGRRLWFYADYPYVLQQPEIFQSLLGAATERLRLPLSAAGLEAWQAAVAAHASQISTFWPNLGAMRQAIHEYSRMEGAGVLWRYGD